MTVMRYEPWDLMEKFHRDVNRLFTTASARRATEELNPKGVLQPADPTADRRLRDAQARGSGAQKLRPETGSPVPLFSSSAMECNAGAASAHWSMAD
mgnify:CR=1 FL=1